MDIGLQMFSLRDISETDMDRALKCAKEAGYSHVEFAGFKGYTADALAAMIQKYGLAVYGTHSRVGLSAGELDQTLADHKTLGSRNFTISSHPILDPAARRSFIETVQYAAPILADNGIAIHYHNHSQEFLGSGFAVYDELVRKTPLNFQIDIYHIFAAGLDPIAVMKRFAGRIRCIHLRDGLGYGLEARTLGEGRAPVAACCEYALANGYELVVENACREPDGFAAALRCREFLQKNFNI